MEPAANDGEMNGLLERNKLPLLVAILVLATVLRLFALDKGIWQDEYGSLRLISGDNLIASLRAHNHPPFYYLVLKATSLLAKDDSFLRLPSALSGVAAVLCLWFWLVRYSTFGAATASLLAATHPLFVHYSQEMRSYGLLLLLTTLAFWLADELRTRWSSWRVSALLTGVLMLAVASHLIAIFIAIGVLFYLGWWLLRERPGLPRTFLLPLVAVPLTFLFFTQVFLTAVYDPATWWMQPPSLAALAEIGREYLGLPALSWFSAGVLRGLVPGFTVLLLGALLVLVWLAACRRTDLPLLAAALCIGLQFVAVSLWVVPVLVTRTGLPMLVPAIAFVGVRLGRLRGRPARGLAFLMVATLATLYSGWWLVVEGRKPFGAWKEVVEVVEPRLRSADLVFVCPLYAAGPLQHYLRRWPSDRVIAFQPAASPDLVAQMRARLAAEPPAACGKAWLVVRKDQNVQRQRGALDALQETLRRQLGEPEQVQAKGLVDVVVYSPPGCREP